MATVYVTTIDRSSSIFNRVVSVNEYSAVHATLGKAMAAAHNSVGALQEAWSKEIACEVDASEEEEERDDIVAHVRIESPDDGFEYICYIIRKVEI